MTRMILLALLLCVSRAVPASAQIPPADVRNPSAVSFAADPDHALLDGYELDIVKADGTVIQTLALGKPTPDASNLCTVAISVQPVAFGVGYTVRVRSKAGAAVSDNVVSLNKFSRAPGGPSKVILK